MKRGTAPRPECCPPRALRTENSASCPAGPTSRRWLGWAVVLAWAAVIFCFSTSHFGPHFSKNILGWLLAADHLTLSPRIFHFLDKAFRKSAHVANYGVFAVLLYITLGTERRLRWSWRRAVLSILIAAGYSLTDEFHQLFVPGRQGSLRDCSIDTFGASVALALFYLGQKLFGKEITPDAY
ncbi:MAG: VanZ family protein [Terriglobia bacterium]